MERKDPKWRHRYHSKLTKKLAQAYAWLKRAEENETLGPGLYYAHVNRAKKQIEWLTGELRQYEEEHPDL